MSVIIMKTIRFSGLIHYNHKSSFNSNDMFVSNSIINVNNTHTHKMRLYGHYNRDFGNPVKSIKLFTPIILLNLPYNECTKSSSDQSFKIRYDMTGATSCIKTTSTTCLSNVKNSEAVVWSELDIWTIYPIIFKYSATGETSPDPKPANYFVEITSPTSRCVLYKLLPVGSESDCHEPSSFTDNGYSSVFFCNRFNLNTWKINSSNLEVQSGVSGYVPFITMYRDEEIISFRIYTSISETSCFLSRTMSIIAAVGSWPCNTFSYHYNSFTYKISTNSWGKYELEALNTEDTHDMAYAIGGIKC